jgi:prepilin-type N-terminal cleavage/methylation domain-containing protein
MPILPTGNRRRVGQASTPAAGVQTRPFAFGPAVCRGVTLMEMMVVLAIVALIVSVSVPSTIAGLESIRLAAGARSVAAFMNIAANRAERRQQAIELSIDIQENSLTMRSPEAAFVKTLDLPRGIALQAVWPALSEATAGPRRFLIQPGGVPPRIGIEIANHRGARRIVRLNPITGVTEIEQPESP